MGEVVNMKEGLLEVLKVGTRFKERMIERELDEARAECPRCKGDLRGFISGPRKHFRMSCKGGCGMMMME